MNNPPLLVPQGVIWELCRCQSICRFDVSGCANQPGFDAASDMEAVTKFALDTHVGLVNHIDMDEDSSDFFGSRRVARALATLLRNSLRRSVVFEDLETIYTAQRC